MAPVVAIDQFGWSSASELAWKSQKVQLSSMAGSKNLQREGRGGDAAANISIRIGTRAAFDASITNAGLLSVGVLVSGILLSTAAIIVAARRNDGTR